VPVGFDIIDNAVNDGVDSKDGQEGSVNHKMLEYRNRQKGHKAPGEGVDDQSCDIVVPIQGVWSNLFPPSFLFPVGEPCGLETEVVDDVAK